jgi:hypothetical protein
VFVPVAVTENEAVFPGFTDMLAGGLVIVTSLDA